MTVQFNVGFGVHGDPVDYLVRWGTVGHAVLAVSCTRLFPSSLGTTRKGLVQREIFAEPLRSGSVSSSLVTKTVQSGGSLYLSSVGTAGFVGTHNTLDSSYGRDV